MNLRHFELISVTVLSTLKQDSDIKARLKTLKVDRKKKKTTLETIFRSRLRLIPLLLRDFSMDSDETFEITVHLQRLHRHLFDFRFRPQTGSEMFFRNRKLKTSHSEVEKYLIGKLMSFCNESHISFF